jgi:hypothetical protein
VLAKPPVWDELGRRCDFYAWFWASQGLALLGSEPSATWQKALQTRALGNQRKVDGSDLTGSFDPIDAWSHAGGRLYSTAMLALCLEAPIRAAKVHR